MTTSLKALLGMEDLHRILFEQAGDYVLVLEPQPPDRLVIIEANEAASAAHGYSREELIGQPISLLDPFAHSEFLTDTLRTLQTGTPLLMEARHRRKDGSEFDVEVRSTLATIGDRRLLVSIERDISERKRAEATLLHSHRLMSYIIEHARSAIAVHDRDMRYIYVSDRYLREYNVKEHDIIGRHHYDVFPDLPQKWRDVHQRVLRGEVCSAEEDSYEREDGTVEWTRWECRPWYEANGTIGGLIVYTEVITDRKRAEEDRKALQNQLQQALKMEAIGRLAGGVAHDFNNLLTSITGHTELALLDVSPEDPLVDHLLEVRRAADSAASLTRQLLAFSRKQIIEPRVISLNDLLDDLHKMLSRVIGEDVTLRSIKGHDLSLVKVDPGQFEQVLVNLAVNARDAMPHGGQLTLETANVELDAEYCVTHPQAHTGAFVRLAVSDTGEGIPDEVKPHLFEPFFTTKPQGRGTGLGLATIFGSVRQAGGFIEVYSEVGHGTTFKLYLPSVEGTATKVARERRALELPRGTERVLLVEDESAVRRLARRILERLGYTVFEAANASEALAVLDGLDQPLDLLITDVVMPGMNGRELASRFTARYPNAKVLFASGYTENVIVHHGVLDENLRFIAKPYTPYSLAMKVRETLAGTD